VEKINDIVMLDIGKIVPNPYQPRQVFDDSSLKDLAQSIQEYGILQPITVRSVDDHFELIMGERRYRAAQISKLSFIPAIVLEVGDKDSAVVALIENLQRVDLSFIEEAESYKSLIDLHGLTQGELSKKLGKSQSTISNKMRLLKLDPSIIDIFKQSKLTERHARALLKLTNIRDQRRIINRVIHEKYNVKETEHLVERALKKQKLKTQKSTFKVNYRIYTNTIKKAFKMVKSMSEHSTMAMNESDDYVEILIKIPKV